MIKIYGADAVRWFILSDSPPERRNGPQKGYLLLTNLFKEYGV